MLPPPFCALDLLRVILLLDPTWVYFAWRSANPLTSLPAAAQRPCQGGILLLGSYCRFLINLFTRKRSWCLLVWSDLGLVPLVLGVT